MEPYQRILDEKECQLTELPVLKFIFLKEKEMIS